MAFVPTTTTLLLFCNDINNMAFVLFWHQQHGFCVVSTSTTCFFVPELTTWLLFSSKVNKLGFCFLPISTTWLSKLTTAGKSSGGCVNLHTPRSHQSSVSKRRNLLTQCSDWQGKAMIGLWPDKNILAQSIYRRVKLRVRNILFCFQL